MVGRRSWFASALEVASNDVTKAIKRPSQAKYFRFHPFFPSLRDQLLSVNDRVVQYQNEFGNLLTLPTTHSLNKEEGGSMRNLQVDRVYTEIILLQVTFSFDGLCGGSPRWQDDVYHLQWHGKCVVQLKVLFITFFFTSNISLKAPINRNWGTQNC